MSYHDGSVWPHDNALIAADEAVRVRPGDQPGRHGPVRRGGVGRHPRLPELFCGFTPDAEPARELPDRVLAAGVGGRRAVPHAAGDARRLGPRPREPADREPAAPSPWLNTVEVRNLKVGESTISMVFRREGEITSFSLLARDGDVRVVMEE